MHLPMVLSELKKIRVICTLGAEFSPWSKNWSNGCPCGLNWQNMLAEVKGRRIELVVSSLP